MSKLTFSPRIRAGVPQVGESRPSRSERRYLDFVIDGQSLSEMTDASRRDRVTLLAWPPVEEQIRAIRMLMLEIEPDLPAGRQSIYVCAECGDIGCGAVTARISRAAGQYVWSDFAFENDYDKNMTDRDSFRHLGPFAFDASEYRQTFFELLASLSDPL